MHAFSRITDGQVFALAPPAISGFGNNAGFSFYLQDANGAGHEKLIEARDLLLAKAAQSGLLRNTRPNGQEDTPQFAIAIVREKARAAGLELADLNPTLSAPWGGRPKLRTGSR